MGAGPLHTELDIVTNLRSKLATSSVHNGRLEPIQTQCTFSTSAPMNEFIDYVKTIILSKK